MAHSKLKVDDVPVGGTVVCGSRKMRIDSVDGNGILDVTLTVLKGETIETRDPKQRDNPWIMDDQGEGEMIELSHVVKIGNKVRVGNHRQFRVIGQGENGKFSVVIVGPEAEVV